MIACVGIALCQGGFRLDGINFTVPTGRYAVLMGRTGCGKTTLLEVVCGLRRPAAGQVLVGDHDVTTLPPAARGLGYVPQDGALFATMDVRAHLAFGPRLHRWKRDAITARVAELAGRLGIAHLLDRRIHGLSGGERQRVALGRALAARPRALLLDEPLSALDEDTQDSLVGLLREACLTEGVTTLHITHNRREAESLADMRLELVEGQVREIPA